VLSLSLSLSVVPSQARSRLPSLSASFKTPLSLLSSDLQSIHGYTWPGIEFGEAPSPKYSFLEVRGAGE
jgi:hypothetical protein